MKLKKVHFFGVLILVGLSFTACKKWELRQPVSLNMNWNFNTTSSSDNAVQLSGGYFYADKFTVSGSRKEGENVVIERATPATKFGFTTMNNFNFSLDIPMGDYEQFNIDVQLNNSYTPAFQLNGTVLIGAETFPYRIEWTKLDLLNFSANSPFTLKRKSNYNLYMCMSAQLLFDNLSTNFWSNASVSMENGLPTIIISETSNPNFFSKINQNLITALTTRIEKQ